MQQQKLGLPFASSQLLDRHIDDVTCLRVIEDTIRVITALEPVRLGEINPGDDTDRAVARIGQRFGQVGDGARELLPLGRTVKRRQEPREH